MSTPTSYSYNVVFLYSTEGREHYTQVVQDMDLLQKKAKETGKGVAEGFALGGRGLRNYIFGLQMGIFYFSMLSNSMARAESAQLSLQDAQDNYRQTLREFGPVHEKTIAAHRRMERAQIALNRTTLTSNLNLVGMGLQMANLALQTLRAVDATHAMTIATSLATVKDWLHVAALKAKAAILAIVQALKGPAGWAVLAGAGGAMVAYGAWQLGQASRTQTTTEINIGGEITVQSETIDEALEKYSRTVRREVKRMAD